VSEEVDKMSTTSPGERLVVTLPSGLLATIENPDDETLLASMPPDARAAERCLHSRDARRGHLPAAETIAWCNIVEDHFLSAFVEVRDAAGASVSMGELSQDDRAALVDAAEAEGREPRP